MTLDFLGPCVAVALVCPYSQVEGSTKLLDRAM